MTSFMRICRPLLSALAVALLLVAGGVEATGAPPRKAGQYNPEDQTVEMFAAIQSGEIAVRLIPKNSTLSHVLIENKTDQPLNVKLPDAFAGVPALAQVGGPTGTSSSSTSHSNSGQAAGGGMGGMGMGMGGMMNVAPEKVGRFDVATVCLEHGKAEPRAAMHYEIKPLEAVTTKPGVRELCQMLGNRQINQRAAQAAAWYLNNGMSWQVLAAKQIHYPDGVNQPYFSPQEIQWGMQIASVALRTAKEQQINQPQQGETSTPSSNSRY